MDEVSRGDAAYSRLRLELIAGLPFLEMTPEVMTLANQLMTALKLPPKVFTDAFHLAVAIDNAVDFLLTWNCAHLANAHVRRSLQRWAIQNGRGIPIICTPEELAS